MFFEIWRGCDILSFEENVVEHCISMSMGVRLLFWYFILMIFRLLVMILVYSKKQNGFHLETFTMKHLGEASFVLGIEFTKIVKRDKAGYLKGVI